MPQPYKYGRWEADIEQDYRNAGSDDMRRLILLQVGYDEAHRAEAERLFGGSRRVQDRKQDDKEKAKAKPDPSLKQLAGLITGGVALAAAVVSILAQWPAAKDVLSQLLAWLGVRI